MDPTRIASTQRKPQTYPVSSLLDAILATLADPRAQTLEEVCAAHPTHAPAVRRRLELLRRVRPDLVMFEGIRERFDREVAAIARLDHPGIVPVHTVGVAAGIPYLAMAWVDGAALNEGIAQLDELRDSKQRSHLAAALQDALGADRDR